MTFYSTTQRCLRGFILHYFGEKAPARCGNCSACDAAQEAAKHAAAQLETSMQRAAQNADRLERRNAWDAAGADRPAARRRRNASPAAVREADEPLLAALYALRKRLAAKQKVPAFMVFSDATLREICQKKPTSMDEFLGISGVGETKAARYGRDFLSAVRGYTETR
jgi:ATP-dependent DNA helicase RecQ